MEHTAFDRRDAIKVMGLAVASSWLVGCGDDASTSPTMDKPTGDDEAQIRTWEANGVLTPSAPGAWGEKIAGHYPLTITEPGGIRVRVAHPMDAEHYIEAIYLKDGSGKVLGITKLAAGDEPQAFFAGAAPDAIAYAVCNLHEVWAAPVVRTKEAPGPWETKINGHTPRIKMIGDEVTVKVPHPMDPDHYIVAIYVTDQSGNVIGKTQLKPGDPAQYTLTVEAGVTEVQAWALCDDHDLWSGLTLPRSTAAKLAQWNASDVRTAQTPGPWAEKIVGHHPIATMWHGRVVVHTPHAMDPDHYIEACYLQDADGYFAGYASFGPGDWPATSFEVTDPNGNYIAYSVCNLHDVWSATLVRTAERPGPWAEKIAVHTPRVTSAGPGRVTVTVDHAMSADHYIVGLYLMDEAGTFVAKKQLDPATDTEASYTFEVSPGTSKLTPWALCDDHDLWMGVETPV